MSHSRRVPAQRCSYLWFRLHGHFSGFRELYGVGSVDGSKQVALHLDLRHKFEALISLHALNPQIREVENPLPQP